jgi:uncharacterized protein Yka (UPF0111/DUF47 family)
MTASGFIYSLTKEIENYIQEAIATAAGALLAVKVGYSVDIDKTMKRIYKNLVKAQEVLNQLSESLESESLESEKEEFEFYYDELENDIYG